MQKEMEDKDILDLLYASGDWALEEIRSKYGSLLYETAFLVVREEETAKEIAEAACMSVWENGLYSYERSLKYVLVRTARNLAYARKMGWSNDYALVEDYDSESGFCKELSALPTQDQALLVARYFYCMKEDEAAEKLGLSLTTVRMDLMALEEKFKGRRLYEEITSVTDSFLELCDNRNFTKKPDRLLLKKLKLAMAVAGLAVVIIIPIVIAVTSKKRAEAHSKGVPTPTKEASNTNTPTVTKKPSPTPTLEPTVIIEPTVTDAPSPWHLGENLEETLLYALNCGVNDIPYNDYDMLNYIDAVMYGSNNVPYMFYETGYWYGSEYDWKCQIKGTDYIACGFGNESNLTVAFKEDISEIANTGDDYKVGETLGYAFDGYTVAVEQDGAEITIFMINNVDLSQLRATVNYEYYKPIYWHIKSSDVVGSTDTDVKYFGEENAYYGVVAESIPLMRFDIIRINMVSHEITDLKSMFGSFEKIQFGDNGYVSVFCNDGSYFDITDDYVLDKNSYSVSYIKLEDREEDYRTETSIE